MLLLFLMIFGIAGWFLSDGYMSWPREAERYEAYSEIRDNMIEAGEAEEAGEGEEADDPAVKLAWQRHAEEAGYSKNVPKERTESAITEQRVIGLSMMGFALVFGAWILWNHRLSVRAEGETVIGASGQRVELDQIIATDRKKWKKKGIAYAIYEVDGKRKRLCLDDHKFAGCEEILLEAEKRIRDRKGETEKESAKS